jgi:S1-C subfamily serine protease
LNQPLEIRFNEWINNMPHFSKIKTTFAVGAMTAMALISVACSGGNKDATATPVVPQEQATATAITANATATSSAPAPSATTINVSNPVAGMSSLDIIKAQQQVFIDMFNNTINSVVRIDTQTRTGAGEGSGWVWDTEGNIVTNYHVLEGATKIDVYLYDGRQYTGRVVGFNSDADLAVVKIDLAPGETLQPSKIGSSSDLQVGQVAIALGNPYGNDFSMTSGIVSAVGRLIPNGFTNFAIPSVIQTDTAINPGNSGGPLLDIEGRVIGINTQIRSDSGSNSGVGFAVPVDLAKRVVPNLIANGEHVYSFMGIRGLELDNTMRNGLGLKNGHRGAYITSVEAGTPASKAGLQGDSGSFGINGTPVNPQYDGDLIVAVDGRQVTSMDDLIAYLALNTSPGDDIVLTVIRGGTQELIVLTLTQR